MMNVSPQQVNKWVKGKENFTLETLSRLEEALGINLLAIDNRDKTNLGNQKQDVKILPSIKRTVHSTVFENAIKDYLESKKSEFNQPVFFSNYRFEKNQFKLLYKLDFTQKTEAVEELKTLWNLFEEGKDKDKVIELKPNNKTQRKIFSENLMVAEPDVEYY